MKLSYTLTFGLLTVPGAVAWGSLGHITTAFIASHFVSNTTEAYFKTLLRNDEPDYLASVASWADSIRYTKWGRFTKNFHFIDAHDNPPFSCDVDYERDCKESGCVISALANYTDQSLDPTLAPWLRAQAAKFVVHFVGDLHQPLHNEDVALGGNRIYVKWDGRDYNLHHVWDTSIAEKWLGAHGKPYPIALRWANALAVEISDGKFAEEKDGWLKELDFEDSIATAMAWSRECNAFVCTHVFPEGPAAIAGQELGGAYFDAAGPVVERQVARAGYRMAVWLDHIADEFQKRYPDYLNEL
ncbi:Nuclease S1-like protein [Emericellopsis cladophorae]|uniref:Nuclease S1-like protein n=1 Tax=Emericellopsis cladophorae TaxID=2686198 RepID=A0A9P9Y2V8_9HYPO|nr:Nuclease S1-like protein [Emericellopsis cladophorae]KAI6782487.1 Nuclease S1-like protein [Emericellopsis cladophorae]